MRQLVYTTDIKVIKLTATCNSKQLRLTYFKHHYTEIYTL